jgi:hypothetical protein
MFPSGLSSSGFSTEILYSEPRKVGQAKTQNVYFRKVLDEEEVSRIPPI